MFVYLLFLFSPSSIFIFLFLLLGSYCEGVTFWTCEHEHSAGFWKRDPHTLSISVSVCVSHFLCLVPTLSYTHMDEHTTSLSFPPCLPLSLILSTCRMSNYSGGRKYPKSPLFRPWLLSSRQEPAILENLPRWPLLPHPLLALTLNSNWIHADSRERRVSTTLLPTRTCQI